KALPRQLVRTSAQDGGLDLRLGGDLLQFLANLDAIVGAQPLDLQLRLGRLALQADQLHTTGRAAGLKALGDRQLLANELELLGQAGERLLQAGTPRAEEGRFIGAQLLKALARQLRREDDLLRLVELCAQPRGGSGGG